MVYNLEKARNIECAYIYCIETQVPSGYPAFNCDALRAEQWCKYVWGEIFNIIPFAQFIDYVIDGIKEMLMNPLKTIISIGLPACSALDIGSFWLTTLGNTCRIGYAVSELASAVSQFISFGTTWSGVVSEHRDFCSMVNLDGAET